MKESFIILLFFCAGVLLGRLDVLPSAIAESDAVTWIVYLMLAAVGMGLGFDVRAWRILRELKGWVLAVPAVMVTKRTDMRRSSAHADEMAHTYSRYYATFQVESGDRMEFQVQDTDYGLLVEGDRGKLTFQGTRFLGFEREK